MIINIDFFPFFPFISIFAVMCQLVLGEMWNGLRVVALCLTKASHFGVVGTAEYNLSSQIRLTRNRVVTLFAEYDD